MRRLVSLAMVLCALQCESRETEANEASLLLLRVTEYTSAQGEEAKRQLRILRALEPTASRVREARDACVEAYTLVQRAEDDHEAAKELFAGVTSGKRDLARTRAAIEDKIARSDRAIEAAKKRIGRCTRLLSDLKREHGLRTR